MAGSNTISLGFKLTGESDMKRALTDLNNALKENASSIELTSTKYKDNEKSAEAYTAKSKDFQKAVDLQSQKLDILKSALENSYSTHKSAGENIQRLKDEIDEASNKMDEMRASTDTSKDALLEQQKKIKDLNKELKDSEKAYASTGKSTTTFATDINKTQSEIIKLNDKLDESSKKTKIFQDRLTDFGTKTKDIGSKLSVVSAAIVGLGALAVNSASDLNESQNKVEVAFGKSANSVKKFSDTTLDSFGIAKGSALDMAALFGDMATSMGLTTNKAAEMSIKLVGLAGDLASFKNLGIEEAQTALSGIFTGETESLKKLGIVMTETNLSAFALAEGIKKPITQMSESEKVQLRYQYILSKTKNSQGDFKNTSDGTANSIRIFQESLKELSETFGQDLLPMITPIIQKLTETIKWFSGLDEGSRNLIIGIGLVIAIAGPLITAFGQISLGVAALMGAFTKLGVTAGASAATTVAAASTAAAGTAAASAAATASMAGLIIEIGLVVAAVAALAFIVYEVYKNWDGISAFFEEKFNSVQSTFDKFKENAKSTFQNFDDWINGQFSVDWSKSFNGLGDPVNALLADGQNFYESIKQIFGGVGQFLGGAFTGQWDSAFRGLDKSLTGFANGVASTMAVPVNGVIGLLNGLISVIDTVIGAVNKIKVTVPNFMGGGTLGFSIPEIPKIQYVSIPRYALGTNDHPGGYALVGENGPEVLKLPPHTQVFPNGTTPSGGDTYILNGNIIVDAKSITEYKDILRIIKAEKQKGQMMVQMP